MVSYQFTTCRKRRKNMVTIIEIQTIIWRIKKGNIMKWRKLRAKRFNEALKKHQFERMILYANLSQKFKNQMLDTHRTFIKFKMYNRIKEIYWI